MPGNVANEGQRQIHGQIDLGRDRDIDDETEAEWNRSRDIKTWTN